MASIDAVGAIGVRYARKLRKAGVRTTEGLLKRGSTRKGRGELADITGVSVDEMLQWVNTADLMRVRGIGSEYADLLAAAGVDTLRDLKRRRPKSLTAKMGELNEKKRLVRRLPTEGMVESWIAHAAELEPMVKP